MGPPKEDERKEKEKRTTTPSLAVFAIVARVSDPAPLGFGTRLWFAFACFFRVLFDGNFARRAWSVRGALLPAPEPKKEKRDEPKKNEPPPVDAALQLLALLQREGRFVDFLEEDVTTFSDADVGAAARVVHEGCRKAMRAHATLKSVRSEDEGAKITVAEGTPASEVKLVGNVVGKPPFTGTLVHRGWRIDDLRLPTSMAGHDARVVAPAEVEL
jgi:hypothetical protein